MRLPTKIESVRFESSSKTQQPQHSNSEQPGFVYFCHFSSAADCTLEKRALWNFCPCGGEGGISIYHQILWSSGLQAYWVGMGGAEHFPAERYEDENSRGGRR